VAIKARDIEFVFLLYRRSSIEFSQIKSVSKGF